MPVYHIAGFDPRDADHGFADLEVGVRLVVDSRSVEILALWEDSRKVGGGYVYAWGEWL